MLTDQTGHGVETDPVKVDLYMENKALRERVAELEQGIKKASQLRRENPYYMAEIMDGLEYLLESKPEPLQGEQKE